LTEVLQPYIGNAR